MIQVTIISHSTVWYKYVYYILTCVLKLYFDTVTFLMGTHVQFYKISQLDSILQWTQIGFVQEYAYSSSEAQLYLVSWNSKKFKKFKKGLLPEKLVHCISVGFSYSGKDWRWGEFEDY